MNLTREVLEKHEYRFCRNCLAQYAEEEPALILEREANSTTIHLVKIYFRIFWKCGLVTLSAGLINLHGGGALVFPVDSMNAILTTEPLIKTLWYGGFTFPLRAFQEFFLKYNIIISKRKYYSLGELLNPIEPQEVRRFLTLWLLN